jgi:hypothetical protein
MGIDLQTLPSRTVEDLNWLARTWQVDMPTALSLILHEAMKPTLQFCGLTLLSWTMKRLEEGLSIEDEGRLESISRMLTMSTRDTLIFLVAESKIGEMQAQGRAAKPRTDWVDF